MDNFLLLKLYIKTNEKIITFSYPFHPNGGVNSVKAGKVYADLSTATGTGSATWTSGTNTFAWTASSYAFMVIPGSSFSGDLSAYTTIGLTVSDLENEFRVDILTSDKTFTGKSITANGNIVLDIFKDFNKQWAADKITVDDLKKVTAIRLNTNSASGSAVVTDFYLYMPPTLNFNAYGKATTTKDDLSATGGLSYDPSTGVLTSDGTAGELKLEFAEPVDLRNLKHYNVLRSGADGSDAIVDCLKFYDEDGTLINTWNGIKWSNTWQPSIDDNATNAFINNKPVKKLIWPSAASASKEGMTLTISSIEWTLRTISCAKAGETQLNTLPYKTMAGDSTTPAWNINTATSTYYGSVEGGSAVSYADVTEYDEVRIYRDNNDGFRAFFVNSGGTAVNNIDNSNAASSWKAEGKYWSIDLSKVEKYGEKVALQGIKSAASWIENAVKDIVAYKTPAVNAAKYTLTGSGMQLAETVAALADATATSIDATGVIGITTNSEGGRTLLESANPNCLFLGKVGNGYLANTNNVVDGDACASLVLTDGNYSFGAPSDFTATSVSYNRPFTVDQPSTVCLPFDLDEDEVETAGTFYELTGYSEGTLTFTEVDEIDAYKPYLFIAKVANPFSSFGEKEIEETPTDIEELSVSVAEGAAIMTGTMARQSVNGKYGWNSADGVFSKATSHAVTIDPFRAYISISGSGSARVAARFVGGFVTGVKEVSKVQNFLNPDGKFIENGKIVIFKNGVKYNAAGAQIK